MKPLLLFSLLLFPLIVFSNETKSLDKKIYNNCEDLPNTSNKYDSDKCNSLLKAKSGNLNGAFSTYFYDKSKQYHLGLKLGVYELRYEKQYSEHGMYYYNHDTREYQNYSIFFESRIVPVLYVGAQLGLWENISCCEDGRGVMFHPYLRFAPFYMLQYFDLGLSSGILTYYIDSEQKDILITFNIYLGFKISNTLRVNLEFGSGSEDLFHFGVIFGILLF